MSIVSLATGDPTITPDQLHSAAKSAGFSIAPGEDEKAFLSFQNAFDATIDSVNKLPEYTDPRVAPTPVEGGERKWTRPSVEDNPLNAWSHKTSLKSADPKAANGPLAGRTFALKDNVSVAGAPLTAGTDASIFPESAFSVSSIDATVVKRILEAGGEIKGTAICENFSMSPLSITSATGAVHNAWAKNYATGGSSSGSGALVSAKDAIMYGKKDRKMPYPDGLEQEGVDMAIGGDQGGSIRLPAAYSGIYGLKPTHGLVPYTGIAALHPMLDHTGPMCRSVNDVALFLGAIAGYDGLDYRMTPESPLRSNVPDYAGSLQSWIASKEAAGEWTPQGSAKGLRIGILKEGWNAPNLQPEVSELVRESAERFQKLGAEVTEVSIPMHLMAASIWTVATRPHMPSYLLNNAPTSLSHAMPGFAPLAVDQNYYDQLVHKNPAVLNVMLNAQILLQKYGQDPIRKAHMHVHELRAAYDSVLESFDVLITPLTPTVGPKIPEGLHAGGPGTSVKEIFADAIGNTFNTCGFNITGHPALSMPCGFAPAKDADGKLPVGMQLIAKRWDELSIFKAAKAWEVGGLGIQDGLQ